MNTSATTVGSDKDYDRYLSNVRDRFASFTREPVPLFRTSVENLFDIYLDAIGPNRRQHYTCSACRNFVNRFGGLVVVDSCGSLQSPLWWVDDVPDELVEATVSASQAVLGSKITGVFYASESVLGTPATGNWHHLSVTIPQNMRHTSRVQTPFQASAEKSQDFQQMITALDDFSVSMLEQAVKLLESEAMYRSEKVLGVAQWLLGVARQWKDCIRSRRQNLLWLAVAKAPAGFCHPRSSMIGTLLEDIREGMSFETIKRRFADKMHPLQYQRPQSLPSAGTVKQAEEMVAKMGIAPSLPRRFARLDELVALWTPTPEEPKQGSGGVFGHLQTKDRTKQAVADIPVNAGRITWEKFRRTILGTADAIEVKVPHGNSPFGAFLTAVNSDAPPIIQWDNEDRRNPVSWYLWHNGSPASQFGLAAGAYAKVNAITLCPAHWHDESAFSHQGRQITLVIDGARDARNPSYGLFPEVLKSDLHAVRSVIEAYSQGGSPEAVDAPAAGLFLQASSRASWDTTVRVTAGGLRTEYVLERWD